jgi:LysR family glycine cleavage system transcriptional activator
MLARMPSGELGSGALRLTHGVNAALARRPELKALEVFEAAARLGRFQKAARELGLTGSAISHQIRVLEDLAGEPLFTRTGGTPLLTVAGEALSRRASAAFREIEAGLDEVGAARGNAALCVSAPPHFAARFLIGRIERFAKRHPAIPLKLNVEGRHVDFDREPVDLAVRFGSGAWAGTAKLQNWVFAIPDYKAKSLRTKLADLTAPPPKPS